MRLSRFDKLSMTGYGLNEELKFSPGPGPVGSSVTLAGQVPELVLLGRYSLTDNLSSPATVLKLPAEVLHSPVIGVRVVKSSEPVRIGIGVIRVIRINPPTRYVRSITIGGIPVT